eukprot:11206347-Alexandrium_andersonii.AAC.1
MEFGLGQAWQRPPVLHLLQGLPLGLQERRQRLHPHDPEPELRGRPGERDGALPHPRRPPG